MTRFQTCFDECCASGDRQGATQMMSHFLNNSKELHIFPLSEVRAAIKQYCEAFGTTPHEVIKKERARRAEWADLLKYAHHIPGLSL